MIWILAYYLSFCMTYYAIKYSAFLIFAKINNLEVNFCDCDDSSSMFLVAMFSKKIRFIFLLLDVLSIVFTVLRIFLIFVFQWRSIGVPIVVVTEMIKMFPSHLYFHFLILTNSKKFNRLRFSFVKFLTYIRFDEIEHYMKVENDLEVLKEVLFTTFCYYSTLSYYKNIMDKTGDIYRITRVYVNKTGIDSLNNLLIPFKQTQLFYPICAQMPHYSFLICISIDKKYTKKKIHKIPPELVRMVKEFLIGI